MKQYDFFEISKADWEFLKKYKQANHELSKWTAIYNELLDTNTKYNRHYSELKEKTSSNIIEYEDAKLRKILKDGLGSVKKELNWIPGHIHDIEIWLEFNRERAVNIN